MNMEAIGRPGYVLGHSEHELARLSRQGQMFFPFTRQLFDRAGIGPGMHVLDEGSGAGDVSLLVAELVGPEGRVVGVDCAEGSRCMGNGARPTIRSSMWTLFWATQQEWRSASSSMRSLAGLC